MSIRLLIVDDEPNARLLYRSTLEGLPYEIDEADSGESALKQCEARSHDVAVLDLRMPGLDGLELLNEMRKRAIGTPAVIVTAFGDVPDRVLALKLGAIDFLQKPLLPDQLRDVIKEVIDRHAPGVRARKPRSIDDCLRCAKRAINLRDFAAARTCLRRALAMEPKSLRTRNLCGVMLEMENEHLITKGSQADSAPEQPVA